MTTQADYDVQIEEIALDWRETASWRIASGWAPDIAFADTADRVSHPECEEEATIAMMTHAAVRLATVDWPHRDAFRSWWNARFHNAPRVQDFAVPCTVDLPDGRSANIIATWSAFTKDWAQEQAQ